MPGANEKNIIKISNFQKRMHLHLDVLVKRVIVELSVTRKQMKVCGANKTEWKLQT